MNKIIEQYVNGGASAAPNPAEKHDIQVRAGLFNKEYSPFNYPTPDFPLSEYNNATGQQVFYRVTTMEITDEEYFAICEEYKNRKKKSLVKGMNIAFKVFAGLMVLFAFILAIVVASNSGMLGRNMEFLSFMVVFFLGSSFGVLIYGITLVIDVLLEIKFGKKK